MWNESKDASSHRYTFREPSPTTRPDVRNLTAQLDKEVAIVAIGDSGGGGTMKADMTVMGGRISPVTLVVKQGTTVQIVNRDPFPHRLYDTGNKGLQAGDTPANKARSWQPPGPGNTRSGISRRRASAAGSSSSRRPLRWTYPDRKGELAIDLSPGKYKLRAYHNGEPVGKELDIVVNPAPDEQQLKNPLVVGEEPKKDEKK